MESTMDSIFFKTMGAFVAVVAVATTVFVALNATHALHFGLLFGLPILLVGMSRLAKVL